MRIMMPIGITVNKYVNIITKGANIEPKRRPSLNQSIFGVVNNEGKNNAKEREVIDKNKAQILKLSEFNRGQNATITKTNVRNNPNDFSEGIFMDL